MKAVKKIEIVVNALEVDQLIALLEKQGIEHYTVLPDAHGAGKRGRRNDDDITGCLKNSYLFTTCSEAQLPKLLERLTPFLKRHHGICLISDAFLLSH